MKKDKQIQRLIEEGMEYKRRKLPDEDVTWRDLFDNEMIAIAIILLSVLIIAFWWLV